jgi:transaldolase/glucose-6-phosphate isomerase
MMAHALLELERLGQSIWLDYLSRNLLRSGDLARLIRDDHLKGVTSNPSIFEKAIAKTNDYDDEIAALGGRKNCTALEAYEEIAVKDIREACDLLRPVYDAMNGRDGFASLEVSPHLANDAKRSIDEGRRLWQAVDRPNLMVKIPGTKEGMDAISTLIADGINVNVTLLFSVDSYENAAMAYLHGLAERSERGLPISSVKSVASFFISRIDSKIDALLAQAIEVDDNAERLMGKIAIANAKIAAMRSDEIYRSDLARALALKGAEPQRLLWASTSTKNPHYRDVIYVESLIGPNTVNTLPLETLLAFRDHGIAADTLASGTHEAIATMEALTSLNIDFDAVCDELQRDGVKLFVTAFDQLLKAVEHKLTRR